MQEMQAETAIHCIMVYLQRKVWGVHAHVHSHTHVRVLLQNKKGGKGGKGSKDKDVPQTPELPLRESSEQVGGLCCICVNQWVCFCVGGLCCT